MPDPDRPYADAIDAALQELLARTDRYSCQEIAVCMTRHVRERTGSTDVSVGVTLHGDLEWVIVYPDDLALEVWEADLIEGVMEPADWIRAGERMIH